MKEGDVLITVLAQSDGTVKNRPVLCIRQMPLFNDFLVCGLSTQLRHEVPQFDEVITPSDVDFRTSGLKSASLIRLSYLAVLPATEFKGRIGSFRRSDSGAFGRNWPTTSGPLENGYEPTSLGPVSSR